MLHTVLISLSFTAGFVRSVAAIGGMRISAVGARIMTTPATRPAGVMVHAASSEVSTIFTGFDLTSYIALHKGMFCSRSVS